MERKDQLHSARDGQAITNGSSSLLLFSVPFIFLGFSHGNNTSFISSDRLDDQPHSPPGKFSCIIKKAVVCSLASLFDVVIAIFPPQHTHQLHPHFVGDCWVILHSASVSTTSRHPERGFYNLSPRRTIDPLCESLPVGACVLASDTRIYLQRFIVACTHSRAILPA